MDHECTNRRGDRFERDCACGAVAVASGRCMARQCNLQIWDPMREEPEIRTQLHLCERFDGQALQAPTSFSENGAQMFSNTFRG